MLNERLAAWLLMAALWLVPVAATAGPDRVVLAVSEESRPAKLLEAELWALGFEVVRSSAVFAEVTPAQLDEIAQSEQAVAAIALTGEGSRVSVWIADRVTGKTLLRTLDLSQRDSEEQAAIVARKTVELLRVSLVELSFPAGSEPEVAPVQEVVEPGPAVLAVVEEETQRPPEIPVWRLAVWSGVELGSLELGLVPRIGLGLVRRLFEGFDVLALAVFPFVGSAHWWGSWSGAVVQGEASAELWTGTAALGVAWRVWQKGVWSLPVELRLGVAWTHFVGSGAPPLQGHDGTLVGPLIEAQFGARRQFGKELGVRFGLSLGTLGVPHHVAIAGGDGVEWGSVLGRLEFGVDFGWD
ncbi:MAG: hypothetical protein AUK47_17110 [Deltaproteobacteria bacterium CG2_30_63_29]|nr:MAG: hypothetical protein AUK47_17110 [Deltaproteobacteria bacterium CG2_30_63_29]